MAATKTHGLDFSLPPAGVGLLPDEDHLAPLQGQLLLPGGRVGSHDGGKLGLLSRLGLALKRQNRITFFEVLHILKTFRKGKRMESTTWVKMVEINGSWYKVIQIKK